MAARPVVVRIVIDRLATKRKATSGTVELAELVPGIVERYRAWKRSGNARWIGDARRIGFGEVGEGRLGREGGGARRTAGLSAAKLVGEVQFPAAPGARDDLGHATPPRDVSSDPIPDVSPCNEFPLPAHAN